MYSVVHASASLYTMVFMASSLSFNLVKSVFAVMVPSSAKQHVDATLREYSLHVVASAATIASCSPHISSSQSSPAVSQSALVVLTPSLHPVSTLYLSSLSAAHMQLPIVLASRSP